MSIAVIQLIPVFLRGALHQRFIVFVGIRRLRAESCTFIYIFNYNRFMSSIGNFQIRFYQLSNYCKFKITIF